MNTPNIIDGPYAGTFAKVGLARIRRIGTTDYKRFEEPAGSGRYVWRLRPTQGQPKLETPWDMSPPYQQRQKSANNQNNEQ